MSSENKADHNKSFYPALTGLRAIAAYLVYLHHFNPFNSSTGIIYNLLKECHIGALIFFVLSGFVITHQYIKKIPFTDTMQKQYFVKRIARICPLYFGITFITFLYFLYKNNYLLNDSFLLFFTNITFTKAFFSNLRFSLVGQGWTLTVEWCFYMCAPIFISLVKRSYNYILIISILFIVLGLLLVKVSQFFNFPYGFFDSYTFMFVYTFFGHSFEFLCGVGLAVFLHKQNAVIQMRSNPWFTIVGAILCISIVFVFVSLQTKVYWTGLFNPWGMLISTPLMPISITLFIYGLITEKSLFVQFLSSKVMLLLGVSSYAFYLLHLGIVGSFVSRYIARDNLIIHFIIIVLLSILVYKYVEQPLYKWIKKLGEKLYNYAY